MSKTRVPQVGLCRSQWLFVIRFIFVCSIAIFQSLAFCQLVVAQQKPAAQHKDSDKPPLDKLPLDKLPLNKLSLNHVERLADKATISVVLASQPQLMDNVGALLRDVGKPEFIQYLVFFYNNLSPYGIDSARPLVLNGFDKTADTDSLLVDIRDRALFRKSLNVTEEQIKAGKPFRLSKKPNLIFTSFEWAAVNGDSLVLGSSAEHTQAVLDRDRKFHRRLPAWSREILNRCDLGMTLNIPNTVGKSSYEYWLKELKEDAGKDDAATVELVGEAMDSAERLVVGSRYENHELKWATGISFNKNAAITKLIRHRPDDAKFSGTAGLPPDNLIASIGFDSNYFKTRSAARVFAKALFSRDLWLFMPGVSPNSFGYDELFSRMFGNFWQHVESSRIGLYSSENSVRGGQFSLVGVLDARDPVALLKELDDLAHITQLSKETDEESEKLIKKLIVELGDTKYLVREDASLRLSMIGKRAIEQLEVAAKSKDLEVAFRARRLLRPYLEAARVNAEKVVGNGEFWDNLNPQFQFEETSANEPPEKVLDYPCTVVRLSFPDSQEQEKMMYSVFGEQWDRIRIVQIGNQFVVLVGSDVKRMERAINNVVNQKDPIGTRQQIANRKLIGDQLQTHFSIARLNNLLFSSDPEVQIEEPGDDLTSLGFSFEQSRWLLNIFVPGSELKVVVDNPRMNILQ